MKYIYAILLFIMLALYATYPTRSEQVRNAVDTWRIIGTEILQKSANDT